MVKQVGALAALVALAGACSSNYIPQSRGRVSMVMESGGVAYVRDGRVYKHGALGGGLQQAVRGVPAAERAAAEYHGRIRDGIIVTVLGAVCVPVAVGLTVAEIARDGNPESSNNNVPAGALIALGCTVAMFGGAIYAASAEPYRWDAINIFNDQAEAPPMFYPDGPPGALRAAKKQTLGMRD